MRRQGIIIKIVYSSGGRLRLFCAQQTLPSLSSPSVYKDNVRVTNLRKTIENVHARARSFFFPLSKDTNRNHHRKKRRRTTDARCLNLELGALVEVNKGDPPLEVLTQEAGLTSVRPRNRITYG